MSAPKFCKPCQEIIYSSICPYCECKATAFKYDDEDELADVSSGGHWGAEDLSTNMVSYDELYSDSDSD